MRLSFQPAQKIIHNGDVRKKALNALFFNKTHQDGMLLENKIQNYNDLLTWIVNSLKLLNHDNFNNSLVVSTFLLNKFSIAVNFLYNLKNNSSTNDERDTNLSLPNEPRRHEKIFE